MRVMKILRVRTGRDNGEISSKWKLSGEVLRSRLNLPKCPSGTDQGHHHYELQELAMMLRFSLPPPPGGRVKAVSVEAPLVLSKQ